MVVAIIACMVVQTQANSMAIICFPAHPTAERVAFQVVHLWRLSTYHTSYICNYIVSCHIIIIGVDIIMEKSSIKKVESPNQLND